MEWLSEGRDATGMRERDFALECEGRRVPGVLWLPKDPGPGPRPLVLLGHGGALHKRADYIVAMARRMALKHGMAAVAIDAAGHGDRRPDGGRDFAKVWAERQVQRSMTATDEMIADWQATIAAIQAVDEVGEGPLGYWGLSMGTIYGLPLVAAEPRIRVATLGLMGFAPQPSEDPWQQQLRERMSADAPKVQCPVLFLVQWDDELVPRDNALHLFGALGAKDKRLHAHPGKHVEVPREEMVASEVFLAEHLQA